MKYISTRGDYPVVSGAEAICMGMAPDGGLFVPETFPPIEPDSTLAYGDLAVRIFSAYLPDFSETELTGIVAKSYFSGSFPGIIAPVTQLGGKYLLELFHGPTAAFKDMALTALPNLLTTALKKTGGADEVVILVATSGDTGKAALEGFKDIPGVRVIVFYPKGGVSELQERQMVTTGGSNTFAVGVRGNFDDCQSAVKTVFAEGLPALAARGITLSSANSINWGRLLPQIVYYYHAYHQLVKKGAVLPGEKIDITVPTGNFGNILAAYYAGRMGLPVGRLICASNENHVLTDAIMGGIYDRLRPFIRTASPSMDILVSSNFERLVFELSGRDGDDTAACFSELAEVGEYFVPMGADEMFWAGYATDAQAAFEIRRAFSRHGVIIDPHTAVGAAVAAQYAAAEESDRPMLLVSTASPYKFTAPVLEALGVVAENLPMTEQLAELAKKTDGEIHRCLKDLHKLEVRHTMVIEKEQIKATISALLGIG